MLRARAGLVGSVTKFAYQGSRAVGISPPCNIVLDDLIGGCVAEPAAQSGIGDKSLNRCPKSLLAIGLEQEAILAVFENFTDIFRIRRNDSAAKSHIFKELQRARIRRDFGLQSNVEGADIGRKLVARDDPG